MLDNSISLVMMTTCLLILLREAEAAKVVILRSRVRLGINRSVDRNDYINQSAFGGTLFLRL